MKQSRTFKPGAPRWKILSSLAIESASRTLARNWTKRRNPWIPSTRAGQNSNTSGVDVPPRADTMAWSLLTMTEKTGLYCNMSALTGSDRERYNQLIRKLEAARIEIQELADGYAFRLQNGLISLAD